MPFKEYRDPLYGFIAVDEVEQKIIDSAPFQRLRHIAQLGTTSWVYPSACHTRFEHSLGTLQASIILFDHLFANKANVREFGWNTTKLRTMRQLLRLAALLHDVGHPPFSHATEALLVQSHEAYSRAIITETGIGEILERAFGKGSADKVASIATGSGLPSKDESFLSSLLTGDVGTDRVDYLIRDSYHLGVAYGRFDVHRLFSSLVVRDNPEIQGPELAVDEGGIHSVEGFLLARYYMFLDVYFHKTRRAFDYHLQDCLGKLLPDGKYPAGVDDYLGWNDPRILWSLLSNQGLDICRRLLARGHFRCIWESSDHASDREEERFDWLRSDLRRAFAAGSLHFDEAANAPLNYASPPLFVRSGKRYYSLVEKSPLAGKLETIRKYRIYAEPSIRAAAMKLCWRHIEDKEKKQNARRQKGG